MSAILLPFSGAGTPDWSAFDAHVERTVAAGLVPAVNMDTGYVQLLERDLRRTVLRRTAAIAGAGFVAGAYVADGPGDPFDPDAYRAAASEVAEWGGVPVVFPSHGLAALDGDGWVAAHAELARELDRFYAFELGPAFVPYGRIYPLEAYRGLLGIPACGGAKHSSLHREPEWERLALRDELRPEFQVLTGNDLAIDMVMYGSDYLLGLSTMAPDAFAERDRRWAAGDPSFFALNDVLQYLGAFCFREPVPAYRHSAAQVLVLRGWATSDRVPDGVPRRPEADVAVLRTLLDRLDEELG